MSLRVIGELAVHLSSFRNVDLFHQGLYQVQCRIYLGAVDLDDAAAVASATSLSARLVTPAVPTAAKDTPRGTGVRQKETKSMVRPREKIIVPPTVDDEQAIFRSATILIRYCEEDIDLNSLACFRFEQDALAECRLYTLEVRLMYADALHYTGGDVGDRYNKTVLQGIPLSEYQEVSRQSYRVHGALPGMQAYCPIIFDHLHFCRVDMVVQSSVVDFRLSLPPSEEGAPLSPSGATSSRHRAPAPTPRPGDEHRRMCNSGGCDYAGPAGIRPALAACALRCGDGQAATAKPRCWNPDVMVEEVLVKLAAQLRECPSSASASSSGAPVWPSPQVRPAPRSRTYCGRVVGRGGYHRGPQSWCKEHVACTCDGKCGPATGCQCRQCYVQTFGHLAEQVNLGLAESLDLLQSEFVDRLAASYERVKKSLAEDLLCMAQDPELATPPPQLRLPGAASADEPSRGGAASARLAMLLRASPTDGEPTAIVLPAAMAAARLLSEDLSLVSAQLFQAWQQGLELTCRMAPAKRVEGLRMDWQDQTRRHWADNSFRATLPASEVASERQATATVHSRVADRFRRDGGSDGCERMCVQDLGVFLPRSMHNVIFEQRYRTGGAASSGDAVVADGSNKVDLDKCYVGGTLPEVPHCRRSPRELQDRPQARRGVHVLILVHGFQGQAFDMRLLRNNLMILYPKVVCHCSVANEQDTEVGIEEMAARLAEEVKSFVQNCCPGMPSANLGRLSFVCHSIGGLIVRAALPLLQEFHDKLSTYVSFSAPHLGYGYSKNMLFRTGFWLFKKLRKARCLEQISLTDEEDMKDAYLSKLANTAGLEHFAHLVLVSSFQDQYAPYESARVEHSPQSANDPGHGPVYEAMVNNFLSRVDPERLTRVDFDLVIPDTNLDTMIGRTAHIQFIECQILMRMFLQSYGYLFE